MFRRNNFLIIMIVLLAAGIIGSLWFYNTYYLPNAQMSSTYMEVYQDLDATEIQSISIDTINHKDRVVSTEDEKVKISYFQRTDSANSFVMNNRDVTLKIIERAENTSNSFFSSTRQIDTITVYLPVDSAISINNKTIEGTFEASNVSAASVNLNSISGSIDLNNCTFKRVDINSNSGEIKAEGLISDSVNIIEVTGKISLSIPDSLEAYNLDIRSDYGILTVNEDRVVIIEEDKQTVVNYLEAVREGVNRKLYVNSLRSPIVITSNEEPPVETNENAQQ